MITKTVSQKLALGFAAVTVILGVICLAALPSTAAVHWDNAWQPNGYLSKYLAVLLVVAVEALLLWFYRVYQKSTGRKAWSTVRWISVAANVVFVALCCAGPVIECLMLWLN